MIRDARKMYPPSTFDRRGLLRGLGAAGLALLVGPRCSSTSNAAPEEAPARRDGGLPLIDRTAPAVTRTATFALG